jgi:2-polyprenyl-3-methyl-5-hydroxy-6-metoxy-1,4-benzoquinol methylase
MPDLLQRAQESEIMDDLAYSGPVLDQSLRELEFINRWLGGNAVTLNAISRLFRDLPHDRTYRIADVGCGGGDMAKHIHNWAKRNKFQFEIIGIDANPNAIAFARANVKQIPQITFQSFNIFSREFQESQYDVVIGTLFYHHFTKEQLIAFFKAFKHQVTIGFIINDIHRHPLAFHSIKILTQWFSKSDMVKNDAPLSVRRAFSKAELKEILDKAGYTKYTIRWKWAFRWEVIVWMK